MGMEVSCYHFRKVLATTYPTETTVAHVWSLYCCWFQISDSCAQNEHRVALETLGKGIHLPVFVIGEEWSVSAEDFKVKSAEGHGPRGRI